MQHENTHTLVINAGSSSLRLSIFDAQHHNLLSLQIAGLGQNRVTAQLELRGQQQPNQELTATDHRQALEWSLGLINQQLPEAAISAVGHRVVYGGTQYLQPTVITDATEQDLAALQALDPEHLPTALSLIRFMRERLPAAVQVACFDTAFFKDLPRTSQLLPFANEYYEAGLRRYGFHGLSYQSLVDAFRALAGDTAVNGRVIYAHLGSGASLTATHGGRPVETTMGFSPASGIVMSTRSGDIDPNVAAFMHAQRGMSFEQYSHFVNFESGLLGVSGLSADMYTLLQHEANHEGAADAVKLFVHQVRKAIGSLAATMNGVDSLIFSGGIGEQSSLLRWRICDGLQFLGVQLDSERNDHHAALISADGSAAGVHVLHSDENAAMYELVTKTVSAREA